MSDKECKSSTLFASIILVSEEYSGFWRISFTYYNRLSIDSGSVTEEGNPRPLSMTTNLTTIVTSLLDRPPIWFYRELKRSQTDRYPNSRDNRLYDKTLRNQRSHFKFPIQNPRRYGQTGEFIFRIRPLVRKRQSQFGSKTFRIRHNWPYSIQI